MEGLSIVVPFLNEYSGIEMFCAELDQYAEKVTFPIELVFVDDGSDDNTDILIHKYQFSKIKKAKVITLSKNFGSHAAIRAGVSNSYYDVCTWMGSDLQEPIEFLELSYEKIKDGYDAVYVEKNSIKVSTFERGFSKIYSSMMRRFAVKNYSSGGISNIVFNKKIKTLLNNNVELNSSIMLQIMDAGYKYTTLSLNYKERSTGVSKWTLSKKIKLFIDSFVAFSFLPIRLVSIVGLIMFFIGIAFGFGVVISKIINPASPIAGYPTLASLISIGFGITNISLGIIAEYLWRAYDAARNRPVYIISDISEVNHQDNESENQSE